MAVLNDIIERKMNMYTQRNKRDKATMKEYTIPHYFMDSG